MANKGNEWARNELGDAALGDKRLTDRLVNIADSLISLPESSINQACGSWSEAKAAYRFFQNENVKGSDILYQNPLLTEQIRNITNSFNSSTGNIDNKITQNIFK